MYTRALLSATAVGLCACAETRPAEHGRAPIPIATWSTAIDTLAGTYTALASASEFGDTLLITTDAAEKAVWQVNTARGSRIAITQSGEGPGEYRAPGQAVRISRDSVALLDLERTRIPIVSAVTGRGRTHALTAHAEVSGSRMLSAPTMRFADTLGHVYGAPRYAALRTDRETGRRDLSTMRALDSIPIVRFALTHERADTVFTFARGVLDVPATRNADGTRTRAMELGAYGAFSDWFVTAGGLLIVADASRSSLQIVDVSQRPGAVREVVIPHTLVPVVKERWAAHVQRATRGVSAEIGTITNRVFSRAGMPAPTQPTTRYVVPDMPRYLPAFNFGDGKRRMHESDGVLWVPVHVDDAPDTEYWDLIDLRGGKRIVTLALPLSQYLVAVTTSSAYVLSADDDDVERVIRYRHQLRSASPPH